VQQEFLPSLSRAIDSRDQACRFPRATFDAEPCAFENVYAIAPRLRPRRHLQKILDDCDLVETFAAKDRDERTSWVCQRAAKVFQFLSSETAAVARVLDDLARPLEA